MEFADEPAISLIVVIVGGVFSRCLAASACTIVLIIFHSL
jgi:hypothetical protein